MRLPFFLLLSAFWAFEATAAQQWIKFSSGTGFFIDREGHAITNAHVVKDCQSITLRTPSGERKATLLASDAARDLAILDTDLAPPAVAPLRWNISDLKQGDRLYLYGFPGEAGATGSARFVRTELTGLHGPSGEPEWLQLQSVAEQGNSGGPVLDQTGNVIAVIAGRAETYKMPTSTGGQPQLVGKADVAVTLSALQDFLAQHQIGFYQSASGLAAYSEPVIVSNAQRFVVPVRCVHGIITR